VNNLILILYGQLSRGLGDGGFPEVLRAQRWKDIQKSMVQSTTNQSLNLMPWIIGLLLAAAVIFAVINSRREKAKRRVREDTYFHRKAAEKELGAQQINLLVEAVKAAGIEQPYRVLDSFDIFQHILEDYEKMQDFAEPEHRHFHQTVDEIKEKLGFNRIEEAVQLNSTHEIRVGQPLRLLVKKNGQDFEYQSSVAGNDDTQMEVLSPDFDFNFMFVDADSRIDVNFYRESDAGYNFSTVISRPPDREKKMFYLKHPKKLERSQARSFSRMEVHFPFGYFHLQKALFNSIEIDYNLEICRKRPVYRGETVDISGGGLAFNTRKIIEKGDFLYFNFQMLSGQQNEPLLAEVVWSGKDENKDIRLVRARFYSITDKMRDELMKFVYQVQRKFARKLKYSTKR
jgi:c-di-GMP-binding flagellar brake protein YcgR